MVERQGIFCLLSFEAFFYCFPCIHLVHFVALVLLLNCTCLSSLLKKGYWYFTLSDDLFYYSLLLHLLYYEMKSSRRWKHLFFVLKDKENKEHTFGSLCFYIPKKSENTKTTFSKKKEQILENNQIILSNFSNSVIKNNFQKIWIKHTLYLRAVYISMLNSNHYGQVLSVILKTYVLYPFYTNLMFCWENLR